MAKFNSLSEEKEFKALNAKRDASLVELSKLKKSLEALSKDKPSLRSLERIESKIDSSVERLQDASEAVSSYFSKMGGNPLNDIGYDQYCDVETNIKGDIEIIRESYHDILKTKGLIQPAAPQVEQSDLINALKTLAECSSKQATATADQAKSMLLHHKVPTIRSGLY